MSRTLTARLEALERKQREGAKAEPGRIGMSDTQGENVYMPAWKRKARGIVDPEADAIDAEYGGLDQLSTEPITFLPEERSA